MLFTSATFAFVFLPFVLVGYFWIGTRSTSWAGGFLFLASLFFYGFWVPEFTALLLASIFLNYRVGVCIVQSRLRPSVSRNWMILGIVFNLGLLAYFKYANFFVDSVNVALGADWQIGRITLPIGISFYCFTQIAYLVDTWQGEVRESRAIHYGLFVTYFPHLIAGPVLHHAQMMPQFADQSVYRFNAANFALGLVVFTLGLLKKVVLADGIAPYADAVFDPADHGAIPGPSEAWLGALAYTFQLYFDFSGYSDMAIGLSWMFNIRLPFNFNSPYKALSISDFWRRWHISLSTFLRDYLYVPLGGNRKGPARRYVNLAATMVLGGIWHGASWSFVLWGALHGFYLMINLAFSSVFAAYLAPAVGLRWRLIQGISWILTFISVVVGWVFFRAQTLAGALNVLRGMAWHTPVEIDVGLLYWNAGLDMRMAVLWCVALAVPAFLIPNSNQIGLAVEQWLRRDLRAPALAIGAVSVMAIMLVVLNASRESVSAFIYFNF